MTNRRTSPGPIDVTGDVTMDWHLVNRQQWMNSQRGWTQADWTCACWQRGEAALFADLIAAVDESLRQNDPGEHAIL